MRCLGAASRPELQRVLLLPSDLWQTAGVWLGRGSLTVAASLSLTWALGAGAGQ